MAVPAPERERKARTEGAWLEEALQKYEIALGIRRYTYTGVFNKIMTQSLPVLNSRQINQFIEATIEYEDRKQYLGYTGIFVSTLIQIAYNAGHNDFIFEPKGTQPLELFGTNLKGTEENPIRLTINAQTGDYCGAHTEHSIITNNAQTRNKCGAFAKHSAITNNANTEDGCGWRAEYVIITNNAQTKDYCGYGIRYSKITNNAQTGDNCGALAEYSTITNNAQTRDNCAWKAKHSIIMNNAQIGKLCGGRANNSTFKTNNQETLRNMLINIPRRVDNASSRNKIIFIHPDGTEEVIKDYAMMKQPI